MYLSKPLTLLAAVLTLCHIALAGTSVLIPWATADGGYGSGALYGLAIDGDNAYLLLALNNKVQFVRISDVSGTQTYTQLMNHATWLAASGQTSCTPFHGFDLSGSDYVQFAESGSDEIWRINKNTGLLIKYCDRATITNAAGSTSTPNLGSVQCVDPADGEHVFYESATRNLMKTGGSNVCSVIVGGHALTNWITGLNGTPNGGMNFDTFGNLYIGSSDGALYKRDSGGNISLVVTKVQITNLTLNASSFFGSMKMGPDGKFYFRNGSGTNGNLLRFDPANPSGTLELFADAASTVADVGNANFACIRYYGTYPSPSSGWAWTRAGGTYGVYLTAIPEPAAFALLGLAALVLRRMR